MLEFFKKKYELLSPRTEGAQQTFLRYVRVCVSYSSASREADGLGVLITSRFFGVTDDMGISAGMILRGHGHVFRVETARCGSQDCVLYMTETKAQNINPEEN